MVHLYSHHALLGHKLALLRDRRTQPARFGQLLKEISLMLLSHATADLPVREVSVVTPVGPTTQRVLAKRVGFAPILRAGAGMIPAAHELVPGAPIWYLGLYRDEETLQPVRYYDKLQGYPPVDIALILDPMLATGGSAVVAASRLKEKGVEKVVFVGVDRRPRGHRPADARTPRCRDSRRGDGRTTERARVHRAGTGRTPAIARMPPAPTTRTDDPFVPEAV